MASLAAVSPPCTRFCSCIPCSQTDSQRHIVSFGTLHRSGLTRRLKHSVVSPRNVAMQDSISGVGDEGSLSEPRQYPRGLQRYESMVVLRPDLTEEQRVALTERYEEALIAGGALDVEMFNRGMQPLAYNIRTKNMGGLMNRYLDGIFLLFTYVTKPESQVALQRKFNSDDDIIRSTTFRLKL
eukprot:TRINITY_DN147_c0_g1_i1.p1 TRINITY_DN147_c0_g1~~TRINITY_DN147_c0_g1_i1.p1  ORF type:complete len:194 (+),score=28.83 TRINITY_DN147_c0_g1_i1:36-584(+)